MHFSSFSNERPLSCIGTNWRNRWNVLDGVRPKLPQFGMAAALNRTPKILLILSLLPLLFLQGCTSSGSGGLTGGMARPDRVVYVKPSSDSRAQGFMPELVSTLRQAGFKVVNDPEAPYVAELRFSGGGWDLTASIVMFENGVPVVSGKGHNPGIGVWLARGAAYNGVFRGALDQFAERIGPLR